MKNNVKWLFLVLVLILLIAGAYYLYNNLADKYSPDRLSNNSSNSNAQQSESYAAPDFTVIDNNGNDVKLSDMKGKPVVVNFWASWCPPCKAEMPDFDDMYNKHGDDVIFMMVNMTDGQQETLKKAKSHIEENGYKFPVYFDTSFSAATAYHVTSLPTTYFINADGNLVTYANGMINYETLEKGIEMIK